MNAMRGSRKSLNRVGTISPKRSLVNRRHIMNKIRFISLVTAVAVVAFISSCTAGGSSEEGNPPNGSTGGISSSSAENNYSTETSSSSSGIVTALQYGEDLVDNRSGIPQTYKTVIIGDQTWTAKNLNFAGYASQNSILGDLYYNETDQDFSQYAETHGRLYSWSEVVCPIGWHLPTKAEWEELMNFVGGRETAGKLLKATENWSPLCIFVDDNSTNDYGFSALPGGRIPKFTCPPEVDCAMPICGFATYRNFGTSAWWWTATRDESNDDKAHCINMLGGSDSVDYSTCNIAEDKLSVRCVKD